MLDRDGPEALAQIVGRLADAAVIDTRVLLAHRHGFAESAWPAAEDRFASDLLAPASIADPWLRALTESAAASPADHPIILGGHTMVNGGLRLLARASSCGDSMTPDRLPPTDGAAADRSAGPRRAHSNRNRSCARRPDHLRSVHGARLYEPRLGYYRQTSDRPTDAGDFLTAPETHPIFGWTVARRIEDDVGRAWIGRGRSA